MLSGLSDEVYAGGAHLLHWVRARSGELNGEVKFVGLPLVGDALRTLMREET